MKYFTSDQHFGDSRIGVDGGIDLFFRRKSFGSVREQDKKLLYYMNSVIGDGELVHLGDVVYDLDNIKILDGLRAKRRTLILGNYDMNKVSELQLYFDEIYDFGWFDVKGIPHPVYCNHYPVDCMEYLKSGVEDKFTLTGHIHGLNVGCDAWHYYPISEDEIAFRYNAMMKFYDENVF
jgi:calcineurin-like phosphoesterase family protein